MKHKLLIIPFLLLALLSCEKESSPSKEIQITETENLSFRLSNSLDIGELEGVSTQFHQVWNETLQVGFTEYFAEESFFDAFSGNGLVLEAIVLFEDCHDESFGMGSYVYSEEDKNLFFNLYGSLEDFNDGVISETYIVNDFVINDLTYIRKKNFDKCSASVFFSENLPEREYRDNYNDLNLKSAVDRFEDDVFIDPGDYQYCAPDPRCRIYNYDPSCSYKCSYNGCREYCCNGKTRDYLVVKRFPDYMNILENVIIESRYYKFRDDILSKSEFGLNYSKMFYSVSDHYMASLDFELMTQIVSILPKVNTAIDQLLDEEYHGVIIDQDLGEAIGRIISTSSDNSNSSIYKGVLDVFQTDFEQFVNKSKSQVLSVLKN